MVDKSNETFRTILFITNHPAPYINRWFEILEKEYKIVVFYYYHSAIYKKWKEFVPYEGLYLKNESILKLFKNLISSDFVVLCGLDKPKYWISLITLITFRKSFALYSDFPVSKNPKTFYLKKILFNRFIPFVFCASESTADYYLNTYNVLKQKLKVFPYAHNFQTIYHSNVNHDRIKSLERGDKIKVFVANSFYKRKGYSVLYEALNKLKSNNRIEEFGLNIAGIGDDFEYYKKLFAELGNNINILGWIENDEYNQLMKQTDIFLHASFFEPFGIPPLDAMENGKLLVVSNGVQSVNSIIKNGVNGFIYSADKSDDLYDVFIKIIEDRSKIYHFGEKALLTVKKHYPKDKILQTLNSCVNS